MIFLVLFFYIRFSSDSLYSGIGRLAARPDFVLHLDCRVACVPQGRFHLLPSTGIQSLGDVFSRELRQQSGAAPSG